MRGCDRERSDCGRRQGGAGVIADTNSIFPFRVASVTRPIVSAEVLFQAGCAAVISKTWALHRDSQFPDNHVASTTENVLVLGRLRPLVYLLLLATSSSYSLSTRWLLIHFIHITELAEDVLDLGVRGVLVPMLPSRG